MHSVLFSFGPVPAEQAEHDVCSVFTTEGGLHPIHEIPYEEYEGPKHFAQEDWFCAGARPGWQLPHDDCTELVTLPSSQATHVPAAAALTFPVSHCTQSAGELQPPS